MSQVRKYGVSVATFSVALGIGFVMQNGDALASRMGGAVPTQVAEGLDLPLLPTAAQASLMPSLPTLSPHTETATAALIAPMDMAAPAMPEAIVEMAAVAATQLQSLMPMAAVADDMATDPILAAVEIIPEASGTGALTQPIANGACTTTLTSTTAAAASVTLDLLAPCAANTGVTFHHQGMLFSAITDDLGRAVVTVPALSETAVFIADVGQADGAVTVITVPDVAMYDRAVLQWQGDTGLAIHAREFGAGYGEEGHVWQAAAAATDGGFITQLGDARLDGALMAQVYTFPTGTNSRDGMVDLTVEAEISAANCGRDITAQSIQIAPGAEPVALDLEMAMPGCDAVGELLVLNNMLEDLTLASR